MARGRMINNDISRDKRVNDLSDDTCRLLFTWLITFADVAGRTYGDAALVRSMVFPRRVDISTEQVENYLQELHHSGLIVRYEAEGDTYIYFPAFEKNQQGLRKDREPDSEIPAPPISQNEFVDETRFSGNLPENIRQSSGNLPENIRQSSGNLPENIRQSSGLREEKLREEKRREVKAPDGAKTAAAALFVESASLNVQESPETIPKASTNQTFIPVTQANPSVMQIWTQVTQQPAIPGSEIERVLPALEALQLKYPNDSDLVAYLMPFWEAWKASRSKNGRPFSLSNCAWLYDWAITGVIPNQQTEHVFTEVYE